MYLKQTKPKGDLMKKNGFLMVTIVALFSVFVFSSPVAAVTIDEFAVPTAASAPCGITVGPDGNLWFTEGANKIGRITTAGVITEFPVPTAASGPTGITMGPDGNLWFTETAANKIGRITTAGVITEFPVPTAASGPTGITMGPDGNLWFTETGDFNKFPQAPGDKIGRLMLDPNTSVPTMSEWGMMLFMVLAGVGSILALHKHGKVS